MARSISSIGRDESPWRRWAVWSREAVPEPPGKAITNRAAGTGLIDGGIGAAGITMEKALHRPASCGQAEVRR